MQDSNDKTLKEWSDRIYELLLDYLKNENLDNYFIYVGAYLTTFTVFETSIQIYFKDFSDMLINESRFKLINLPKRVLSKLFEEELKAGEFIDLVQKDILTEDNSRKEKNIVKKINKYFRYSHFNEHDTNDAIVKLGVILDDKKDILPNEFGEWFENLVIPQENELEVSNISIKNTNRKKAIDFISDYSANIRHVIAHEVPTTEKFEDDLKKFPINDSIHCFKYILDKIYERYVYLYNKNLDSPKSLNSMAIFNENLFDITNKEGVD